MKSKVIWIGIYLLVLLWSVSAPKDMFTWWLEAIPALIALPILFFSRKSFPLTPGTNLHHLLTNKYFAS